MHDDDIEQLFERVSSQFENVDEDTKKVFHILVNETLSFRDELIKQHQPPLKVEEVAQALNALETVLHSKSKMPDLENRVLVLFSRWVNKLNRKF